jgi:hypothetical protein
MADLTLETVATGTLFEAASFNPTNILPAKLGAINPYYVLELSDFN